MRDKIVFQPETFPLEVLSGESSDELETLFEDTELEEERGAGRGGGFRGGGLGRGGGGFRAGGDGRRFRQGFSARRGGPGRARVRPGLRPGPPRPWPHRPGTGRRWPYIPWPVGGGAISDSGSSSEHVRWAQDCLNRAMSLSLPVDGTMSAGTRSAIRSFQQRQALTATGLLGPDTEEALKRACAAGAEPPAGGAPGTDPGPSVSDADAPDDAELFGDIVNRIGSGIGNVFGQVARAVNTANIIDLTASADKSVRKGTRDPKSVYALVLHQMACCFKPKDPLKRFLSIGAHFAITHDGRILQLHPVSALVWASNGFNNRSVAVEFAGNFPSTRGRWWEGEKFGMNRPTPAQVTAGRQLIQHLVRTMGLTHVLAHRQSSGTRENDPGPDIWFDVGQWAVNTLGLKDGGPGFKIGNGNAIPEEWRTWGSRRPAVTPEFEMEDEAAFQEMETESENETEIVHDVWDREYAATASEELTMQNTRCGCRRCVAAGAGFGSFETESPDFESGSGHAAETESELLELSEEEEVDLALELLAVSSEEELDQFLGKLFRGAWKGIRKVGSVVGKIAKPLGGVLRAVAKKALPLVGGALGSFIPIPGVGTAVGSALGGAIGNALELETGGMSAEDRELEVARRFVRIATTAARQAVTAPSDMDGELAANQAVVAAARRHLSHFQFDRGAGASAAAQQGRWVRRGREVVLLGA